jgi:hypothetical protein
MISDAVIRSDSSAYIDLFARMYRRFRARVTWSAPLSLAATRRREN